MREEKLQGIYLHLPADDKTLSMLRAGDSVYLNGTIFTARDAAHKRLVEELSEGLMPELINGAVYYAGPTPPPPGRPIGSVGPTTSSRMDAYSPLLMEKGLRVMIGKGPRSETVRQACERYKGVYLVTTGGAGALLAQCVKKCELVAYEDLGCEAIYRLEVENFPAFVAFDTLGESIFD